MLLIVVLVMLQLAFVACPAFAHVAAHSAARTAVAHLAVHIPVTHRTYVRYPSRFSVSHERCTRSWLAATFLLLITLLLMLLLLFPHLFASSHTRLLTLIPAVLTFTSCGGSYGRVCGFRSSPVGQNSYRAPRGALAQRSRHLN